MKEKASEVVKWFFLFLNTESAMLMRIEFLVVVIALLLLVMSFLDLFRRRSRSSAIKYILLVLDAICDSTFIYTIGLMQSAPFKKDLFPVWALILVNLRSSVCFISAYGIPDQDNRRITEAARVMGLLGVAFLITTFNNQFKYPIWALWAMQQSRSIYLINAYNFATASLLHGWSSPLLTAYMGGIRKDRNPTTIEGCEYLVSGDHKQKVKVRRPDYKFELDHHGKSFVTLDKVYRHTQTAQDTTRTPRMEEMCLSFALYRLLRCRFDHLPLPLASIDHTRALIYEMIGKNRNYSPGSSNQVNKDSNYIFRIVKWELAFLNDYFYTRYPVLFWRGFPLLAVWHPFLTIAFVIWLGRDLHKIYKPKAGETAHVLHGVNVDLVITWIFLVIIVLKELWKMAAYLLSDWTKVMLLCEYTAQSFNLIPQCIWKGLVSLLCTPRSTLVHRWHNKIDQYEFLQSFSYSPWSWNILYYLSLGLVARRGHGEKTGNAIDLPEDVKVAVVKSLISQTLEESNLPNKLPSLMSNLPGDDPDYLDWTFKLGAWSSTILVWHIATSLCEIELAQHYNTSLTFSELLREIKAALSCCSSSQPYVIKEDRIEGALRANYVVANSLSRYCAYLVMSEPDLLPDSYLIADDVFRSTVAEASQTLKGCDTLQSIYRKLIRQGSGEGGDKDEGCHHPTRGMMILEKSAQLGWYLIHKLSDDKARWKLLADVWADIVLHTAPSWNAAAHKTCLATGGEFLTHIWAILSHCNVQGSNCWPNQETPHDDHEPTDRLQAPVAQQQPTAESGEIQVGSPVAQQQPTAESGEIQVVFPVTQQQPTTESGEIQVVSPVTQHQSTAKSGEIQAVSDGNMPYRQ